VIQSLARITNAGCRHWFSPARLLLVNNPELIVEAQFNAKGVELV